MIADYDLYTEAFRKEDFSGRFWNEIAVLNATHPHDEHTGTLMLKFSSNRLIKAYRFLD